MVCWFVFIFFLKGNALIWKECGYDDVTEFFSTGCQMGNWRSFSTRFNGPRLWTCVRCGITKFLFIVPPPFILHTKRKRQRRRWWPGLSDEIKSFNCLQILILQLSSTSRQIFSSPSVMYELASSPFLPFSFLFQFYLNLIKFNQSFRHFFWSQINGFISAEILKCIALSNSSQVHYQTMTCLKKYVYIHNRIFY